MVFFLDTVLAYNDSLHYIDIYNDEELGKLRTPLHYAVDLPLREKTKITQCFCCNRPFLKTDFKFENLIKWQAEVT